MTSLFQNWSAKDRLNALSKQVMMTIGLEPNPASGSVTLRYTQLDEATA
jgi:hypothetical protein